MAFRPKFEISFLRFKIGGSQINPGGDSVNAEFVLCQKKFFQFISKLNSNVNWLNVLRYKFIQISDNFQSRSKFLDGCDICGFITRNCVKRCYEN